MFFGDQPFVYDGGNGETYEVTLDGDRLRIVHRDGLNERTVLEGGPDEVLPLLHLAAQGGLGGDVRDIAGFRAIVETLAAQLADIAGDVVELAESGRRTGWQVRSDAIVALAEELEGMAAECRARSDALMSGKGHLMLSSVMEAESLVGTMTDKALELHSAVVRLN